MEIGIVNKGLAFASRKKRLLLLLAALGASGYGVYGLYHAPSVARKRRRLARLLRAMASMAELVSDSAEAVSTVSRDLRDFLTSDSDEIPRSLRQVSKMAKSDEFCESLTRLTEALTAGILRGSESSKGPSFAEKLSEGILSPGGTGFASSEPDRPGSSWLSLACGERSRELMAESIRVFVSTAVTVYLDRTMDMNLYDDVLTGLTNPKHRDQVRDVLVLVCNAAVETLVKTSHQLLSSRNEPSSGLGWDTLAVPGNRKFVLDVTGRVTFETVRSVAEFALFRLSDCMKRTVCVVGDEVAQRGLVAVTYFGAKSSVIVTVCLALYLHVFGGARLLLPA